MMENYQTKGIGGKPIDELALQLNLPISTVRRLPSAFCHYVYAMNFVLCNFYIKISRSSMGYAIHECT